MKKKLKILTQILLLVLVPAFVFRPVVVYVHTGVVSAKTQQNNKSISSGHSTSSTAFRSIDRESPDVTVLNPQMAKTKAPSLLGSQFVSLSASGNSSPKSFFVLRI